MKKAAKKLMSQFIVLCLLLLPLFVSAFSSLVYAATFTPNMAKRNGPGPFGTGMAAQGSSTANNMDRIDFPISGSTTIAGNSFTRYFDKSQGSIVFWITPEWDGDDGNKHCIFHEHNTFVLCKETNGYLKFDTGWSHYVQADVSAWNVGETHLIEIGWDYKNKLDGTNYKRLSIDNVQYYGSTAVSNIGVASAGGHIGYYRDYISPNNAYYPANAIIEGFTIYRRPLFDGTYGIDVGNGDEIAKIYDSDENAGNGLTPQDPILVTGSWDVVFALPTNQSAGVLATTDQAWSHPHASNLLYTSTTNTGGFMMNGTYTSDGWAAENAGGSAVTVAALAAASKIYAGGYSVASTGTANQGIKYTTGSLASGADYVIRVLGHSDTTCNPIVKVFRADGTTLITSLAGTTTSTRADPDVYIFTFETLAAEAINISLLNTAATGTCSWHQVEVLTNVLINGNASLETGSGDPWIPDNWINNGYAIGESVQETSIIHSGSSSFKSQPATAGGAANFRQSITSVVEDDFYAIGLWKYSVSGSNYGMAAGNNRMRKQSTADTHLEVNSSTTDVWEHLKGVAVRDDDMTNSMGDYVYFASGYNEAQVAYFDDYYVVHLDDVALTITPASEANSTENTDELRVDGRDTYVASSAEAVSLGTTTGYVSFNYRPRHAAADAVKFAETSQPLAYVAALSDSAMHVSGKQTGGNNAASLTDSTKVWTTNQYVNQVIVNITDSSYGTITANTATGVTATLTGGTENDWDTNDQYEIVSPNSVRLFWPSANTLMLAYCLNGACSEGTWDATSAVAANTEYALVLSYTGGSTMTLSVDGTNRIALPTIPESFAAAPNTVYFGSDTSGANQGDATFSNLVFDNTAPSISLTALSPDPNNDSTPALTGTATESIGTITAVQFQMDATAGSWTACSADDSSFNSNSEAFTCTVSVALSDGAHTMNVRATDSNGNTTADGSVTTDIFTIDTSVPTDGSVSYSDGYYSTASVSLTVDDGTDATAGIDTSSRTVQRKSATLSDGTCGSYDSFATIAPSGSYPSFTDTSVSTGTCYQYRYLVSDLATNQATYTSSNTVKMDTAAPAVPGTPTTTTPTSDTTPTWSWTASSDTASGLSATPYTIEWSQSSSFASGVSSSTSSANSFTHVTPLTDGTWYVRVRATDAAGNESGNSSNGSVQVNTGAPTGTVSINSGSGYTTTSSVTLTLSASSGFFSSTDDIQMKISNLADLSDVSYEAFAASKAWTLLTGDGTKTVYVQFKDNTNNESGAYTDLIVLDTTAPTSFDLQDPGSNAYTNSDRPTFKWKAATSGDVTSGLSKYKLEVDNGESGDFTIDDIPVSRTTTYEALKYEIRYENFNDSDTTNNYILVTTRSSIAWGTGGNDGKLKEGKRNWKVVAVDNAGNEKSEERTVFVDRTAPSVEVIQVNDTKFSTNNFSTTDKTPTIFGKITDSLSGDSSSDSEQVRNDNKVTSGPKSIEVTLEKKNTQGNYDVHTLATINLNESYWSTDGTKVTDNSQNTSAKFSPFEFTPKESLATGEYRVKIKGRDKEDNAGGETTLTLLVGTFQELATLEEKVVVETLIEEEFEKELPDATEEEKQEIKEEITQTVEITKTEESNGPSFFETVGQGFATTVSNTANGIGSFVANVASQTGNGVKVVASAFGSGMSFILHNTGEGIASAWTNTGHELAYVGTGFTSAFHTIAQLTGTATSTVAHNYSTLTQTAPGVVGNTMAAVGNGARATTNTIGSVFNSVGNGVKNTGSTLAQGVENTTTATQESAANVAFSVGVKTQDVSDTVGLAIIKFTYNFVNEPTRIADVSAEVLSPTSVKITWTTNHPADGKVNWGYESGVYEFEEQTDKRTPLHEFIITNLTPDTRIIMKS